MATYLREGGGDCGKRRGVTEYNTVAFASGSYSRKLWIAPEGGGGLKGRKNRPPSCVSSKFTRSSGWRPGGGYAVRVKVLEGPLGAKGKARVRGLWAHWPGRGQ